MAITTRPRPVESQPVSRERTGALGDMTPDNFARRTGTPESRINSRNEIINPTKDEVKNFNKNFTTRGRQPIKSRGRTKPLVPVKEEKKKNIFKRIGSALIDSEKKFGETIGAGLFQFTKEAKMLDEVNENRHKMQQKLIQAIRKHKKAGNNAAATRLLRTLRNSMNDKTVTMGDIVPAINKTNKQVLGEAAGVGLDILSFGAARLFKGAKATAQVAKQGKNISKTKAFVTTAKAGAKEGAVLGAGFGASEGAKADKSAKGIFIDAVLGTVTGGVLGGVVSGVGGIRTRGRVDRAKKIQEKAREQYIEGLQVTKEKYKQKGQRVVQDLLDNKVAGSRRKLMKLVDEKQKLTSKQYEQLGELKGVTEIDGIFTKIDDEIKKLTFGSGDNVLSVSSRKVKALQALREDLQSVVIKEGGTPQAHQETLRKVAAQYGEVLFETRKALKSVSEDQTLSQVKKVDGAIRKLLNTNNPDYAKINKVYHLYGELGDILLETQRRKAGQAKSWLKLLTLESATVGAVIGVGGGIGGSAAAALTMGGLAAISRTAWWNTMRAVQKNNLALKLLNKSPISRADLIQKLLRLGEREAIKQISGKTGGQKDED